MANLQNLNCSVSAHSGFTVAVLATVMTGLISPDRCKKSKLSKLGSFTYKSLLGISLLRETTESSAAT